MWDIREVDSSWVWLEPGLLKEWRLEGGMAESPMDLPERIRLYPGGTGKPGRVLSRVVAWLDCFGGMWTKNFRGERLAVGGDH